MNPSRIRVGLVQINNSFSGQNYFPYSVGILQSYAQKHLKEPGRFEFMVPLYRRIPVAEAVERLTAATIVMFSTYVWNIRISLEIARRLKEKRPEILVVFGGPQVPNRVAEFMEQHPFIDLACHGEGEPVFTAILENHERAYWKGIPSVTFRGDDGALVHTQRLDRIKQLDVVPSPYLEGVFSRLIQENPDERWIALWETNRGCPFSCTFCDWGSAVASKVFAFDLGRLRSELDWFADNRIEYIFCADANFGILPRDVEIAQYAAETKKAKGFPHALSVQNTKNATERAYKVQSILSAAGLNKGVALSMQSMDESTLKAIKRGNISLKTYGELQQRFTRENVETYSDMILALPGETYDSFAEGCAALIEGGQHNRIQFNNLSILPNAEMADPDYRTKYGIESIVSKVVNIHGSLDEVEEVFEEQELVIATSTMPRPEWVRTRAFSWMTALLYFDKVFQIPLTIVRESCGLGYRELLESFTEGDLSGLPTLAEVRDFFRAEAKKIQEGGPEYVHSKEWLNIWWPADEYVFIKLVREGRLETFYAEAERLLSRFLRERFLELPADLLAASIRLNRELIKRPFQVEDVDLDLEYNVWEVYRSVVQGGGEPLVKGPRRYHVNRTKQTWKTWDDWCREVVWWGNKKGAYLYGTESSETELAGHY